LHSRQCLKLEENGGTLEVYRCSLFIMSNHNEWPLRLQEGVEIAGGGDIPKTEGEDGIHPIHSYKDLHEYAGKGSFNDLYHRLSTSPEEFNEECREMRADMFQLLNIHGSEGERKEAEECLSDENVEKMLTLIWLYDKDVLFPHSVNVFRIGSRKFHRSFSFQGESFRFFDHIVSRVIKDSSRSSRVLFLESLLLHDVGKLDIPASVIDNSVSDEESLDFVSHLPLQELRRMFPSFPLREEGKDAVDFEALEPSVRKKIIKGLLGKDRINKRMPIRYLIHIEHWKRRKSESDTQGKKFSDDLVGMPYPEDEVDMSRLSERGLVQDGSETLGSILPLHEEYSKRILELYGLHIPAFIAAHHHSLDTKEASPEESALFTVIQFCDMLEAMTAKRQYNPNGRSTLEALSMIVEEAERFPKKFSLPILAICVDDELQSGDTFSSVESDKGEIWKSTVGKFVEGQRRMMMEALRGNLSDREKPE